MNTSCSVASGLVVALLAACTSEQPVAPSAAAAVNPDPAHNSRNALDWAGVYRGVLPCADCSGIDAVLTLEQDGTFRKQSRYRDKGDEVFVESGSFTWTADGGMVDLAGNPPTRFRVGENHLVMLAQDGSVITGGMADHYVLQKVPPGILGKRWQLVELRGQPLPPLRRAPYIELDAQSGRVAGFAGCNSLSGSYTLDEATLRIRFENMMTTLMACAEGMDTEQAFNEVLGMVDNYSLGDGQLSLNRARMAPLARFEAVYLP